MASAFTDRLIDRYQRDDADSIRIEMNAAPPGTHEERMAMKSRLLEEAAEAHREVARKQTQAAWELRPVVKQNGSDW